MEWGFWGEAESDQEFQKWLRAHSRVFNQVLGVCKVTKDRVTFMAGEHFGECEERAELLWNRVCV